MFIDSLINFYKEVRSWDLIVFSYTCDRGIMQLKVSSRQKYLVQLVINVYFVTTIHGRKRSLFAFTLSKRNAFMNEFFVTSKQIYLFSNHVVLKRMLKHLMSNWCIYNGK